METTDNDNHKRKNLGFTPKRKTSIIKVLGVGGGGSNAVNHMYKQGIEGVDFIVCNTDMQALAASPVPIKVQLGNTGLGAGGDPEKAAQAAEESVENIKEILDEDTEMLFITAGMGGGTGTGAAPVIARIAHELGFLTVGIVTLPFRFEGRRKRKRAEQGIAEMRKYIDTLLVISNDKLPDFYKDLSLGNAFEKVDNVLTTAAKGIADIITVPGYVNVDFEDVKTVMKQSGKAIMGSAEANGEGRATKAISEAMTSPLLNDNDITGARKILLYISTGINDIRLDEIMEITDYILQQCGDDAEIIWGRGMTEDEGDNMGVTIIATGFDATEKIQDEHDQATPSDDIDPSKNSPVQGTNPSRGNGDIVSESATSGVDSNIEGKPDKKVKKVHPLDEPLSEDRQAELNFNTLEGEQTDDSETSAEEGIHIVQKKKPEIKIRSQEKKIEEQTSEEQHDPLENNSHERARKLKEMSLNTLKKSYHELESEPAYIRKKVQLSEPNYSSKESGSKTSLGKDNHDHVILKPGASFLHNSVD